MNLFLYQTCLQICALHERSPTYGMDFILHTLIRKTVHYNSALVVHWLRSIIQWLYIPAKYWKTQGISLTNEMATSTVRISNAMTAASRRGLGHCKTRYTSISCAATTNACRLSTMSTSQSKAHANHTLITPSSVSVILSDSNRQHHLGLEKQLLRRRMSTQVEKWAPTITLENMNPCVKKMEYAVRGPLVIRATEIEKEIENVSH